MSTIQADVLQLSRLSDGMLLKWCLQSVFFPLVTRRRQKWLEALPGCGSEPQEDGRPARRPAFLSIPVPSQLETRQFGKQCDAGLSAELIAWVHWVGSCAVWRQWVRVSGLFTPPAGSGGHRSVSQVLWDQDPQVPADSSSSSSLEHLGCVAHPAAHPQSPLKTSMCFIWTFYQTEGKMSPVLPCQCAYGRIR